MTKLSHLYPNLFFSSALVIYLILQFSHGTYSELSIIKNHKFLVFLYRKSFFCFNAKVSCFCLFVWHIKGTIFHAQAYCIFLAYILYTYCAAFKNIERVKKTLLLIYNPVYLHYFLYLSFMNHIFQRNDIHCSKRILL